MYLMKQLIIEITKSYLEKKENIYVFGLLGTEEMMPIEVIFNETNQSLCDEDYKKIINGDNDTIQHFITIIKGENL